MKNILPEALKPENLKDIKSVMERRRRKDIVYVVLGIVLSVAVLVAVVLLVMKLVAKCGSKCDDDWDIDDDWDPDDTYIGENGVCYVDDDDFDE